MANKEVKLIDELFKKVKRNRGENQTHFRQYKDNLIHQADLLYLPHDQDYKYCLVVVDDGSRKVDAEPLKTKLALDVVKAFRKIYKRGILKQPKMIETDAGKEFKGDCMNYFDSMIIKHRIGKIARHKQQSLVERKNQQLGKMIFKRMTEEELLTGEPSTQWVDDLKGFVKEINDKIDKQRLKKENNNTTTKQTKKKERDINAYKCEGDACEILTEGQKVRVVLEYPRNVHDSSRLMGKFRDGDIRWEVKPRIIKQVIIEPNQPPMYLVSMIDDETQTDRSCAYTKNELLPVKENEIAPREEMIRPTKKGKQELYYVEKIEDKKKDKGRIYYLIKYKGIKEPSWEPKTELIKFIPDMIDEYEQKDN